MCALGSDRMVFSAHQTIRFRRSRQARNGAPGIPGTPGTRLAFTLMEVLIVVVILGILAAIVVVSFGGSVRESEQRSFISSLQTLVQSVGIYQARELNHAPDSSTGILPNELEDYMDRRSFEALTPIGGRWDIEYNDHGVTSAVGVHFDGSGDTRDAVYMAEIDALCDDGDLTTGTFRQLAADRYYWVIVE